MADRFNVRTAKIPANLRQLGFVAYIADSDHPDMLPGDSELSVSWHITDPDAQRVCRALNLVIGARSCLTFN